MEVEKIMLTIHAKLVEAMIAQAHKDHPIETCGVIAGPQGCNLPLRLIPMRNAARSAVFFKFDPNSNCRSGERWRHGAKSLSLSITRTPVRRPIQAVPMSSLQPNLGPITSSFQQIPFTGTRFAVSGSCDGMVPKSGSECWTHINRNGNWQWWLERR